MTGLFSHAPDQPTPVGECPHCGWPDTPLRADGHVDRHNQRLVNRDDHGRPYTYSSPDPCPGTGQPAAGN